MGNNQFKRIPEPELMTDADQVDAYASADFSEAHDRLINMVSEVFPGVQFAGHVLNLGCGSGDDTFRFLRRFPNSTVLGIDGSAAMIARAKKDLVDLHEELKDRVQFIVAYVPGSAIPEEDYIGVMSNSLLHHMHDPLQFWECVVTHSTAATPIFVADLRRPCSNKEVETMVRQEMLDAPEILQTDFRNSLKAAYTVDEIKDQLQQSGLDNLKVKEVGERHLIIYGMRG